MIRTAILFLALALAACTAPPVERSGKVVQPGTLSPGLVDVRRAVEERRELAEAAIAEAQWRLLIGEWRRHR
jgi:hypothetical protein